MKKIEIICIGELKFKELKVLEKEYLKRIGYYADVKIRVIKETGIKDVRKMKDEEGRLMAESFSGSDFIIGLDEKGKKLSSEKFANLINEKISYHSGRIVFVIGGFAGLSDSIKKRFNLTLSFSDMTFPHDLFRVFLLEQIYRGFTIIKGITYHR